MWSTPTATFTTTYKSCTIPYHLPLSLSVHPALSGGEVPMATAAHEWPPSRVELRIRKGREKGKAGGVSVSRDHGWCLFPVFARRPVVGR